jgi:hypothetical protein
MLANEVGQAIAAGRQSSRKLVDGGCRRVLGCALNGIERVVEGLVGGDQRAVLCVE